MFGRKRDDAPPTLPPWTPMPPGTVRDPEAMEDESAPDGATDDERYW